MVVDYVSKWVEANSFTAFFRGHIYPRFGTPRAIISDNGSHFCNHMFSTFLEKYGVKYKVATPYHPQTRGRIDF